MATLQTQIAKALLVNVAAIQIGKCGGTHGLKQAGVPWKLLPFFSDPFGLA